MVQSIHVAKLFLYWSLATNSGINNLKMQKLLYYAQAWYLVNFKKRLFVDDIVARSFGPVIPNVYRRWKTHLFCDIPYKSDGKEPLLFQPHQLKYLATIFAEYNNLSTTALTSLSQNELPWVYTVQNIKKKIIQPWLIREFYTVQHARSLSKEKIKLSPGDLFGKKVIIIKDGNIQ